MTSAAIEMLAAIIEAAKPIQLTSQVRVDPDEALGLIAELRAELPEAASTLDRFEALIGAGRPIPLAGDVRIDRDRANRLVKELRAVESLEPTSEKPRRRLFGRGI